MRDQFNPTQGGNSPEEREGYVENAPLEEAFAAFQSETDEKKRTEAFFKFLHVMAVRITEGAMVPMPFADVNGAMFAGLDAENVKVGDTLRLNEDVRLRMDTMRDGAGDEWLPLFLSDRERCKGHTANIIMPVPIVDVLRFGFQWESVKGVVVNPFGTPFAMGKNLLQLFLRDYEAWVDKNKAEKEERPQS